MPYRRCLPAALVSVALLPAVVWAVDTPANDAPAAATSAADPLRAAREAIAAKQWGQAIDLLKAQLPAQSRNADLHNLLGYSYRKQASPDLDKAFEHYRIALDIHPGHRGAHEYLGEAYLMRKQPAQARVHLETLQRLCGGTGCEEYQDLARAIAAYRD